MTEVRVAVLGASGWMGKVHTMAYQTFPHFLGTAGGTAKIVSLVEANPKAAADLAFRAPGAKILTSWQDAVQDPEVDLIDICLPDSLHYEVARAALLAGKHVYCEKPLTLTIELSGEKSAEAELRVFPQSNGANGRSGCLRPRLRRLHGWMRGDGLFDQTCDECGSGAVFGLGREYCCQGQRQGRE